MGKINNITIYSKGLFCSKLEEVEYYVKNWSDLLKENQENDERLIEEKYQGEDWAAHDGLIHEFYNSFYAQLLISLYSALEYDLLRILRKLKNNLTLKFNSKYFSCCLSSIGIQEEDIEKYQEKKELNLYCNAYKHNAGRYTEDLCECNIKNCNEGEEIDYTKLDAKMYYESIHNYLCNLYQILKEKNIF